MTTLRLSGDCPADIARAGELLAGGGVVASPTETVYGLAASALDPAAAGRVFAAKGRPADNPLIVHISGLGQLSMVWRRVPRAALLLAQAFWPGPLTLVLPRSGRVPDIVTGGLCTVGVRLPDHPVARAVIEAARVPLAAPSANLSGRPSATSAAHVLEDFDGRIDGVIDGGSCAVGVESTVVDLTGPEPVILRPGAITEADIAAVLGAARHFGRPAGPGAPPAPGMKYRHYAPQAPLTLFCGAPEDTADALAGQPDASAAALVFEEYRAMLSGRFGWVLSLGESWDHAAHARRLFDLLRRADRTGASRILAQAPRAHGRGTAAFDRLGRASAGRRVDCTGPAVVGITGKSGSGKSLVAARLAGRGAEVLDADGIYRRLLAQNTAMQAAIAARFPQAAGPEGIDRRALAAAVFSEPAALAALSAITHPYVMEALRAALKAVRAPVAALDVPVLFGSGADRLCTMTVGLLADADASAARIMARDGLDEPAARARLAAQQPDDFFVSRCDLLIHNRGGRAELLAQADALADRLGLGRAAEEKND